MAIIPERIAIPAPRRASAVSRDDHAPVRSGSRASCTQSTPTARTRATSSAGESARRDQEHTPTRRSAMGARDWHARPRTPRPARHGTRFARLLPMPLDRRNLLRTGVGLGSTLALAELAGAGPSRGEDLLRIALA